MRIAWFSIPAYGHTNPTIGVVSLDRCGSGRVPNGVICLMSAARYYELTNFLPDQ